MTNNKITINTATSAALWRYDNLLCGKTIDAHDEYYTSSEGEEHLTPLVKAIYLRASIIRDKGKYFQRGVKKAARQFVNCNN